MNVPKIWRVENSKGRGCYSSGDDGGIKVYDFLDSFLIRHASSNGHPSPNMDVGIKRSMRPHEICGFISLEQASIWFSKEEIEWLNERGFYLKEVEVNKITAIGQYQILAQRAEQYEEEFDYCLQ